MNQHNSLYMQHHTENAAQEEKRADERENSESQLTLKPQIVHYYPMVINHELEKRERFHVMRYVCMYRCDFLKT